MHVYAGTDPVTGQPRRLKQTCPDEAAAAVFMLLCAAAQVLCAGAAPVPDDGYRLPLGKPGAGGKRSIEVVRAQFPADLRHQIGFHLPQIRPWR